MAEQDSLQRVQKCYADRKSNHAKLCQDVQDRYMAFYGMFRDSNSRDDSKNVRDWTHKLAAKWAMQIAEGVFANLIDDRTRFQVRPRPRMANQQEIEKSVNGARALEILLSYQLDTDRFNEKLRDFIIQDLIAGWTVGKVYWRTQMGMRDELQRNNYIATDEYGGLRMETRDEDSSYEDVIFDGPCFSVVKVEDFLWEEAATSLDDAGWVLHRSAISMDQLEELQEQGIYNNIAKLKESENNSSSDEFSRIHEERYGDKRFKDRVELWEYWSRDGKLITIANRSVVIRDTVNPFDHGGFPFVVCSTSPDPFRIPGLSLIDKVKDLQSALWSIGNQRLDNLELVNNFMLAVQRDIFDAEQLDKLYPGKVIDVSGPVQQSIMTLAPDPQAAVISLSAEEKLVATMQNTTGGFPFMAGVNSGDLDQKTATGVSIVTNIAQKMVMSKKQQLAWCYERVGDLMVNLNRQFLRDPVMVGIMGADGAASFQEIDPVSIHGFDYHVNIEATSESLMRQEKRAEIQVLAQLGAQLAPVLAAISQADPSKRTINMEALWEDVLRAYDKDDIERYFSVKPQPSTTNPGNSQTPMQPGNSSGGVTSPLASGPMSPSNAMSNSPEMFMQRMLSQTGRQN